jgi:hypothetical protein
VFGGGWKGVGRRNACVGDPECVLDPVHSLLELRPQGMGRLSGWYSCGSVHRVCVVVRRPENILAQVWEKTAHGGGYGSRSPPSWALSYERNVLRL